MYVLLFLAITSGTPAQLGTYKDEATCQAAIRDIFVQRSTPRGVNITPDLQKTIDTVVEMEMKLQRDYKCQKQS